MTLGFTGKYVFDTEEEAKIFSNKMKAEMNKLPEFLKPKS